jgi:hypothetical protein
MGACLTQPAQQSEPALHDVQTATDNPHSLTDRVSSLAADLADTDAKARAPDAASTAGGASHPTRGDLAPPPPAPASATLPKTLALPHDADLAATAAVRAFAAEVEQTAGPIVHVEGAEHRATTLRELGVLVEYVEQHSGSWIKRRYVRGCVRGAWRDVRGLKPEEVNLYDVNLNVLSRLGAELNVAYSELFSHGQQRTPKVFVSHAWSHSLLQTYEALKQHAEDRGYGEDEPIWICAFAIRQHQVDLPAITESPFYLALKKAEMTVVVVAAEGEGVFDRSWCGLEAFLAMVEGGAGHRTDIYTHHGGRVLRLTDGLIDADRDYAPSKASRDAEFPFEIIERASRFALARTEASVLEDFDNIMAHVRLQPDGEKQLDATVCARYFVAGIAAAVGAEGRSALVDAGMKALRRSALPRLVVTSEIDEAHAHTLVGSLPGSMVELLLPSVCIGDEGAKILGTFLASSKAMRILDLSSNQIGDAGAVGLGKALEVNATLTRLDLDYNQIGDPGAIGLGKALEVNATLTELNLGGNEIGDAGAIGLGKALEVNATLTELDLSANQIGDAGAIGLGKALEVNATLTKLVLYENKIGDAGAIGLGEGLKVNATLPRLDLYGNEIGDAGAIGLGKALEVNATLPRLDLYGNEIGDAGAIGLGKAL